MIDKYRTTEGLRVKCDSSEFANYFDKVAEVYQRAFTGHPWYEGLSIEEVESRITCHMIKPGFGAYIDMRGENVAGALWYDTPSLGELRLERGDELGELVGTYIASNPKGLTVWEREIIVDPEYAGQGTATSIRSEFIKDIKMSAADGALVLTRMRSNNYAIMKIAEKSGFVRTGITIPCTLDPDYYHEYWALQIES